MSTLTAYIIEDEIGVQKIIEKFLEGYNKDITLVGKAKDVTTAVAEINELKPQLLLVDVEIIGGTGFDVLKAVELNNKQIIFITAHQHYAFNAIKQSAVDYLLKPINSKEFNAAINKALLNANSNTDAIERLSEKIEQIGTANTAQKITLKDSKNVYFVNPSDIIRCEADGKYTVFIMAGDTKRIVVTSNLKHYEAELLKHNFIRCHHSHMVNMQHVVKLNKMESTLHLSNNDQIPLSLRKRKEFFE